MTRRSTLFWTAALIGLTTFLGGAPAGAAKSEATIRREANALIDEGESDIRSGQNLLNKKESAIARIDIPALHARGQEMVEQGEEKISRGKSMLEELERSLIVTMEEEIASLPWKDAINTGARQMLDQVAERGYKTSFIGKTALFKDGIHTVHAGVSKEVDDAFVRADQGRFTAYAGRDIFLVETPEGRQSKLEIKGIELKGTRRVVAVVYGEVIYEPDADEVLVCLRAVNVSTWVVVASEIFRCPLDTALAAHLGVEEAGTKSHPLPNKVTFTDQTNFFRKISSPRTRVRLAPVLRNFESATLPAVLKHLVANNTRAPISDGLFLGRIFTFEDAGKPHRFEPGINTEIVVTPDPANRGAFVVAGRRGKQEVFIGPLTYESEGRRRRR